MVLFVDYCAHIIDFRQATYLHHLIQREFSVKPLHFVNLPNELHCAGQQRVPSRINVCYNTDFEI